LVGSKYTNTKGGRGESKLLLELHVSKTNKKLSFGSIFSVHNVLCVWWHAVYMGSLSIAVQNFNAHTLRMFHSYPKAIWLLR